MTMPNERAKSLLWARALLKELALCKEAPEKLRNDARFILRHYPLASQVTTHGALIAPEWLEVDTADPVMARSLKDAGDSDYY
jgi:hypothetical protein